MPIADALAAAGIELVRAGSPYGDDNTWWSCACVFDEKRLRERLSIDASVTYYEYDGRAAGSDATFTCKDHKMVIMGLHPSYAPKDTRRLG